ncbi:MAG: hypothetical protein ACP5E4_01075 [Candidatus Aenigmatarchaeota archaeon]
MAEVLEVHSSSIDAKLVDYGQRAYLNVANIPGLWIRDVKKFMKKGDLFVAKAVRLGAQVELSMKNVSKLDTERKLHTFRHEKKSVRMFEKVSEEFGIPKNDVQEAVSELKEKYGGVYESLRKMREGDEDLGLKEDFASVIERFGTGEKTYEFKGELELHSNAGDGVERIREAFGEIGDVDATYLGSGRFLLKMRATDPKKGEKILQSRADATIKKMQSLGGTGKFSVAK